MALIVLWGQDGCPACQLVAEKLARAGKSYIVKDISDLEREPASLRREVMACLHLGDGKLPVVQIGGDAFSVPTAMEVLGL